MSPELPAAHTIRLGPPWEVTAEAGRVRHARKFGRPRTLAGDERVRLVFRHIPGPAEITLNDEPLGSVAAAGPFAADITTRLLTRNSVVVLVTSEELLGLVVLEINKIF